MEPDGRDRWQIVSPHLDRALDMTDEERGPWLEALRAQDPGLASELEALLEEGRALGREEFLESVSAAAPPPASLAGQQVGA